MKRKAFTLVELLVVIAIIAVLLAILMPSLQTAKQLAKRLQCAKKLSGIGRAYNMYVEQYDGSLPVLEYNEPTGNGIPSIQSTYLLSRTGSYRHLGCLYGAGFIDDGKVFFCPAVEGWYGNLPAGNNNGTYLGAVHNSTGVFADCRPGVSQPNQGWKSRIGGYCYWPLSKTEAKAPDLALSGDQPRVNSSNVSRYNVGLPLNASKIKDLMMTRPIVTDNKFHTTKMSGWLIDCLFPDGHVTYQKQPRKDGLNGDGVQGKWGMYSDEENCQLPDEMYSKTKPVAVTDPAERSKNLASPVTPTQFSYALEQ